MKSLTERQWLLPGFLVLAAVVSFVFIGRSGSPQQARAEFRGSTQDGIMAVTVQLDRESYGLAMIDTVNETMWVYGINVHGPAHSRLKLLAARSWKYDKLLEGYNTAEPKPQQVKTMLESFALTDKSKQNSNIEADNITDSNSGEEK